MTTRTLDVRLGFAQDVALATYAVLGVLAAGATFIAVWIGAGVSWGLLLGLVFGWVPAAIAALLMRYLWPAALVVGVWGYVAFWR